MSVPESRILDLLAEGCERQKREGSASWAWQWTTQEERLAFDLFLVRTGDELAYQPGTPESRFNERVRRMVHLSETGRLS
jgi:hypothetical protein